MGTFRVVVGSGSAGGALEVEVALSAVAVVPDVPRGAVGKAADRGVGLLVVGDVDPEGEAPVAGVAVVERDRVRIVGDSCDDATGKARLRGVARLAVEDLLAGEDPQLLVGEPGRAEWCGGPLVLLGVGENGVQKAFTVQAHRPCGEI